MLMYLAWDGLMQGGAAGDYIIGGLLFGTLLTLYVIPAACTLLVGAHRPAPDEEIGGGRPCIRPPARPDDRRMKDEG